MRRVLPSAAIGHTNHQSKGSRFMWKIINSPIIIMTLVLVSLFSYDQLRENTASSEIRAVYEELISISEDAKDDLERKKLIEGFVKEAGKQIKEGFGSFNNEEDKKKKAEENKHFFETKKLVLTSPPKIVENTQHSNIQKTVIYQVKNDSQEYLNKVAHTIELYNQNELVDVKDEWGNIKLAPGESKSYSYNVYNRELAFDSVKITVNDISIMEVAK